MSIIKILWNLIAMLVGIAFIGIAYFYYVTPAGSLPLWMPGFIEGSDKIHYKHAIATALLGLASFAFAWFASGSGNKKPMQAPDNLTGKEILQL